MLLWVEKMLLNLNFRSSRFRPSVLNLAWFLLFILREAWYAAHERIHKSAYLRYSRSHLVFLPLERFSYIMSKNIHRARIVLLVSCHRVSPVCQCPNYATQCRTEARMDSISFIYLFLHSAIIMRHEHEHPHLDNVDLTNQLLIIKHTQQFQIFSPGQTC